MDLERLKEDFLLFDKNKDGLISSDELRDVLKSLRQYKDENHLREMIREYDTNGDGFIDFDEFRDLMSQSHEHVPDMKSICKTAFDVFDENKDGYISAPELKKVMENLGEKLSNQDIKEMMKAADTDGDGLISLEEFQQIMEMTL